MRLCLGIAFYCVFASLAFAENGAQDLDHVPLNITTISSRGGYSVLQCWQLASIPIDAMQAANYPVGNTTVATWSRIEPKTHVGEAWAPHVQLSVILNGLIRITSPAPGSNGDASTGTCNGARGDSETDKSNLNSSMLIMPEGQRQLVSIVGTENMDNTNAKTKRPETQVAYIMPGTLKSSVVIAADLRSMSTIAGHYTEFPSNTEPTILVQIPFEGDKAPEHTVLHDGPCI
ncbi:hypothetical protein V8F20_009964 [Naviculisporaceae sp. PSN 640]